ncbi:hypothetical protein BKA69DRAFT_1059780, partial [Paraphysoderma sedebokerense]
MKDSRSSSNSLSEYLSSLPDYSDPARRLALFAAFPPSRDVNPHSWDAKLAFWSDLLLNCARSGLLNPNSILTLNANDLPQLLAVDGLRPLGLGTVLYQLHQSQKILPVAQVANLHAQSWLSWTLSTVIVTPLQWSLRQIGLTSNVDSDHEHQTIIDGEFVVMPLIKEISEQILHKHQSDSHYRTDHLLALSDFSSSYSTVTLQPNKPHLLSKSDLKLILSYMEYAGHIVTVPDSQHEMLIKFKAAAEKSAPQFTPIDRNILTLKTTISNLHSQSTLLESKLSELTTKIKSYLAANAKARAMFYLKSKKQLEKVLNDRLNSLSTLENALLKIQTCETEKEVSHYPPISTTLHHPPNKPLYYLSYHFYPFSISIFSTPLFTSKNQKDYPNLHSLHTNPHAFIIRSYPIVNPYQQNN